MSKDLMYIDYANGMSPIANSNTIRLYKEIEGGKSIFICSAPYESNPSFSVSNKYVEGEGGLILSMLKNAAQGLSDADKVFGQGQALLSSAMDAASNLINVFSKKAGAKTEEFFDFLKEKGAFDKAHENIEAGAKDVDMPWEHIKIYKSTSLGLEVPTMSFYLLSSDKLSSFINDNYNENKVVTNKLLSTLPNNKQIAKFSKNESLNSEDNEGDLGKINVTGYYVNNLDANKTPVKYFLTNILLNHLAGTVAIPKPGGNIFKRRTIYGSPTNTYNGTKIISNVLSRDPKEDIYDLQNLFWMAVGDFEQPIIFKYLMPMSIKISPSNVLTTNNDYLYAKVDITLDRANTLFSEEFASAMIPTATFDRYGNGEIKPS